MCCITAYNLKRHFLLYRQSHTKKKLTERFDLRVFFIFIEKSLTPNFINHHYLQSHSGNKFKEQHLLTHNLRNLIKNWCFKSCEHGNAYKYIIPPCSWVQWQRFESLIQTGSSIFDFDFAQLLTIRLNINRIQLTSTDQSDHLNYTQSKIKTPASIKVLILQQLVWSHLTAANRWVPSIQSIWLIRISNNASKWLNYWVKVRLARCLKCEVRTMAVSMLLRKRNARTKVKSTERNASKKSCVMNNYPRTKIALRCTMHGNKMLIYTCKWNCVAIIWKRLWSSKPVFRRKWSGVFWWIYFR